MPPISFWFTGTALYLAASFIFAVGVGLIGIKDMIPKKVFYFLLAFAVLLSGAAWRVAAQQEQDSFNQNQILGGISKSIGRIANAAQVNPNQSAAELANQIINKLPKPAIPTAEAISQDVVQGETNAHLETYIIVDYFTPAGGAGITIVAKNPGNAAIKINRIETSSNGMEDDENDVGFQRVLQSGSSVSKFIILPDSLGGPTGLVVEVLYTGIEQAKPKNLLSDCRFDLNKLSPIKIEIDPIGCRELSGNNFIPILEAQQNESFSEAKNSPKGTIMFIVSELTKNGLPNSFFINTSSKLFLFNPEGLYALFISTDGHGVPKVLYVTFKHNPIGNHNHFVAISWDDTADYIAIQIDKYVKSLR